MSNDYRDEEISLQQQALQSRAVGNMGGAVENDDLNKWELDVEPFLDRLFHELLGHSHDDRDGSWIPDPKREKVMNELGAGEFVTEISNRVSIHMQLSQLEENDIIEISSRAAEIFGDKIEDNWERWKIRPFESNMESIAQKLYDNLRIALNIALRGGMKTHRERRRQTFFPVTPPSPEVL